MSMQLPARRDSHRNPVHTLRIPISLLYTCLLVPLASPAPFTFTDIYTPKCSPIPDPPPKGFERWSNPKTWPNGVVPGVDKARMVNVTIPCNKAVLLDVPDIRVNTLQIQGLLRVEDPAKPMKYNVRACFVLVEGQLHIGTKANHFKSQITFTLAPNPFNRQEYSASFNPPADKNNPRLLGHKAFAVMGGYVDLHGMPGGGDSPSWVKLAETGREGQAFIIVDRDVSQDWPVGAKMALAPTSFYDYEAEEVVITAVTKHPKGSRIALNKPLQYEHFGDALGVPDGFGGYVDERGEVALLSRNIMITGVDEKPPFQYEGGHFIIFFTQTTQSLEGVEFWLMGQQGTLGRYNIHLHVCGDVGKNKWVIRKNSIHDSKQRCVVVHATHNVTIDSNVAYNTSGHCFMVEEGGEMDNTFINNLGFRTRRVDRLIMDGPTSKSTVESDNVPSTFWITNMRNRFIGNVAAGSEDTGFWAELRPVVRGFSQFLPSIQTIVPAHTPILEFRDNVAHSNGDIGFRCYPNGVKPKAIYDLQSSVPKGDWPDVDGIIRNFQSFKNRNDGFFMHASRNIYVVDSTFADNKYGVAMRENKKGGVINSRFVGVSGNIGSLPPSNYCARPGGQKLCGPIKGCKFNGTDKTNLRPTGGKAWNGPIFGVLMEQLRLGVDGTTGEYNISNNRFHGFNDSCGNVASAIGIGIGNNGARDWWNSAQTFSKIRTTAGVNSIWFTPPVFVFPQTNKPFISGEPQTNYAIRDGDGSLTGYPGAAVISNAQVIQPPKSVKCMPRPRSNAVVCPTACFRTFQLAYLEQGFSPLPYEDSEERRKRGEFSWVSIRRVSDGVTRQADGNLNSHASAANMRFFVASLYAPAAYIITIHPPTKNPNFLPESVQVGFRDPGGCTAPLTITLNPMKRIQWSLDEGTDSVLSPCPGVKYTVPRMVQYSRACQGTGQALTLALDGKLNYLVSMNNETIQKCPPTVNCGVYGDGETYRYNTSGRELRGVLPGNMGFQMPLYPMEGWRQGRAIIGFAGYDWAEMRSITQKPSVEFMTFYYRKTISVSHTACYSALVLDFVQIMGLVAYLNGVEIFRHNLPGGPLTAATPALRTLWWPDNAPGAMNSTVIDLSKTQASLVEGTNYLAFETHVTTGTQTYSYFDTRVSLRMKPNCKGAKRSGEVCDGLDNNGDGKVDVDPKTSRLLTRPCSTACGKGIETCSLGAYRGCTAPQPRQEICNGKDDNCDGLIDNGDTLRLNCPAGSVCFQGQCQVLTKPTAKKLLVSSGASDWMYSPSSFATRDFPNWMNGSPAPVLKKFTSGRAPFSTATGRLASSAKTRMAALASPKTQFFFLKRFVLSAAEARETQSLRVSVRRDQGVLVLSNGKVVLRNNVFSWFDPTNPDQQFVTSNMAGTDVTEWRTNDPPDQSTGFSGGAVKAGTNWLAAIVATDPSKSRSAYFDIEVFRNMNVSCSSLPGKPTSCLRTLGTEIVLLQFYEMWKYLDLASPLPAWNWMRPEFNDQQWREGRGPLGNTMQAPIQMDRDKRVTYFFRKTLEIPDGHCYFNLTFDFKVLDGAIFYVNGAEAYRFQMDPLVKKFYWTYYSSNMPPAQGSGSFTLSAGWLRKGKNVLAAELHLSAVPTGAWFFDMALVGRREDVTCKPGPVSK